MSPESLASPTAIPPRTSSTGVKNGTARHSLVKPAANGGDEGEWAATTALSNKKLATNTSYKYSSTVPAGGGHARNRSSLSGSVFGRGSKFIPQDGGTMWTPDKENILLGPYDYMLQHPGKDIRRQFITAFNCWLKVPEPSLDIITKVVVMLHTASLL